MFLESRLSVPFFDVVLVMTVCSIRISPIAFGSDCDLDRFGGVRFSIYW